MIRNIRLYTIEQSAQRYKTIGDWFESRGETHIIASNLEDQNMEFLILIHELVEMTLCRAAGITQEEVDIFDKQHEDEQDVSELGDLTNAPYARQHCIATAVERLLAAELGVSWAEYEEKLNETLEGSSNVDDR